MKIYIALFATTTMVAGVHSFAPSSLSSKKKAMTQMVANAEAVSETKTKNSEVRQWPHFSPFSSGTSK